MNTALNIMLTLPEMLAFSLACIVLLIGLFIPEETEEQKQQAASTYFWLAQGTLFILAASTLYDFATSTKYAFHDMFVRDPLSDTLKLAIYILVGFVLAYSREYAGVRGLFRSEYAVLALFGVTGMMIMISANHMITLYLGLELLSLSLYALIALHRDGPLSTEAAMKYFVLGAIASGMLLYGMSMIYGVTGNLDLNAIREVIAGMEHHSAALMLGLIFVIAGMAFKLGLAPFHTWVPDVYHGAPTSVTVYLSTAPKIAGFALFMRLLVSGLGNLSDTWQGILAVIAVLSIAMGNLIAIAQTNLKRMLAYSSIAHMGFLMLGILSATQNGYTAAMYYVLVYAVMSLGTFGMIILMSRAGFEAEELNHLKGLNQRHPWYAFLMLIFMLSMAGVPPTLGFSAKLMVIQAVVDAGLFWVAVAAVVLAVVGAYYYLRVIKLMYFDSSDTDEPITAGRDLKWLLGFNAMSLLILIPWAGLLIRLCAIATGRLPS